MNYFLGFVDIEIKVVPDRARALQGPTWNRRTHNVEIDRTFILLVIGFGLLGGLTLLSYSTDAIKLHQKQMEFMLREKKRRERQEAARQAVMEVGSPQAPEPVPPSPRKTT